jgi:hypothetical protein
MDELILGQCDNAGDCALCLRARRERPALAGTFPDGRRALAEAAEPRANISREERSKNVERALNILKADSNWFRSILEWRVAELEAAHKRLRALLKERPLTINPHLPPDILGCFVLIPVGGQN